jgi:hypothetical protein
MLAFFVTVSSHMQDMLLNGKQLNSVEFLGMAVIFSTNALIGWVKLKGLI